MNSILNGQVTYRTRCLSIEQAGAFARCLQGNAKFQDVAISESSRAKGDRRWIVTFLPSSLDRQAALIDAQQDARAERAATQGFTFALDKDAGRPFFWCHSHTSGEVYEVCAQSCSCADFEYRCKAAHLFCKHQLALRACDPATIRTF